MSGKTMALVVMATGAGLTTKEHRGEEAEARLVVPALTLLQVQPLKLRAQAERREVRSRELREEAAMT